MQIASCTRSYVRRQPESTVLHQLLCEELETFLAQAQAADPAGRGLPAYVERELRALVLCGSLAAGFCRARCEQCGHSVVVAFSCKGHLCPSCATCRMEQLVAHLTLRVLPEKVPYRLWTVSFPFDLRPLLAADPAFLSFVHGAFVRRAIGLYERRARAQGLASCRSGAIGFVQLFDATLKGNPHLHCVLPDGVFTPAEAGALRFHEVEPSPADLEDIALSLATSIRRCLCRRGRLSDDGEVLQDLNQDATVLERLFEQSARERVPSGRLSQERDALLRPPSGTRGSMLREVEGVNLHADLRVEAHDRDGLMRLIRYSSRPAFAHEQFSRTPDGRIAFALRKPRKKGATHLFFRPLELLRRLAWLIPRPRVHLVRYAGVFASGAAWRSLVVPRPPRDPIPTDAVLDPCENLPVARASRLRWAQLLARVYGPDLLVCPRPGCSGQLRIIAAVTRPDLVRRILEHLGLPTEPPTIAPARDPPTDR